MHREAGPHGAVPETQFRGDTGIHGKEFHTQTQPVGGGNLPSGPVSPGSRSHMRLSTCMFFMRKELTAFVIEAIFSYCITNLYVSHHISSPLTGTLFSLDAQTLNTFQWLPPPTKP